MSEFHTTGKYILDAHGEPVEENDLLVWARWMEKGNLQVAYTPFRGYVVSTVFLGTEPETITPGPAPVLFETRILGGDRDGEKRRYKTRAEARAGHMQLVGEIDPHHDPFVED